MEEISRKEKLVFEKHLQLLHIYVLMNVSNVCILNDTKQYLREFRFTVFNTRVVCIFELKVSTEGTCTVEGTISRSWTLFARFLFSTITFGTLLKGNRNSTSFQ